MFDEDGGVVGEQEHEDDDDHGKNDSNPVLNNEGGARGKQSRLSKKSTGHNIGATAAGYEMTPQRKDQQMMMKKYSQPNTMRSTDIGYNPRTKYLP